MTSASKVQCLVTGVYRSGTEFVAQLLSGHPALSSTMYHVNALRFVRGLYGSLSDEANMRRAVSDTALRLETRYQLTLDQGEVHERFAASPAPSCCALYDAIMSVLWLKNGRTHWAEKCQLVWREIPEFIRDMPNGKAIIVLRDPRSTLASFKHYTYAPPPAYLGAIFNCLDAFAQATAYRESLPAERFLVVRYEDVARAPRKAAQHMLRFLELDPSLASFDRTAWRDEKGAEWRDNTAFAQTFDVERAVQRWRGVLDEVEVGLTEEVCRDVMRDFDYQAEGSKLDWRAALKLCLADPQISECLRLWLVEGTGVQAFPTDPLAATNWEENARARPSPHHVS